MNSLKSHYCWGLFKHRNLMVGLWFVEKSPQLGPIHECPEEVSLIQIKGKLSPKLLVWILQRVTATQANTSVAAHSLFGGICSLVAFQQISHHISAKVLSRKKILSKFVLMNSLKSHYWVLGLIQATLWGIFILVSFWFVDKSPQLGLIHMRKCCAHKKLC